MNRSARILAAMLIISVIPAVQSTASEIWTFSANEVTSIQSESNRRTILTGKARVLSESREIEADHLELSGRDNSLITGEGDVKLVDLERNIEIRSQRFVYDRLKKVIRFREQVSLVDELEGIVIRCDFLEEEELVVMQVSVRLIKDRTVCRGEFARFSRDDKILNISGAPVVWRDDDEYRAERIQVNLDTDEIVMEGEVEGSLTTGESDD